MTCIQGTQKGENVHTCRYIAEAREQTGTYLDISPHRARYKHSLPACSLGTFPGTVRPLVCAPGQEGDKVWLQAKKSRRRHSRRNLDGGLGFSAQARGSEQPGGHCCNMQVLCETPWPSSHCPSAVIVLAICSSCLGYQEPG